jgi:hypothetical protein
MREPVFKVITDDRILLVIIGVAVVWRVAVSLDRTEALWESICSGISLFIMGWLLLGYMHSMSLKPTRWSVSNKIYHGIGISLLVLNVYAVIYYVMRWFGLLHVEVYQPLDFIFQTTRYLSFLIFYAAMVWSAKYLKRMHEEYRLLLSRSKLRKVCLREAVFNVITDERTLLVMIGMAFLWRTVISFDDDITLGESMASGITLIIMGWFLFGYIFAFSVKARDKLELPKVIQGFTFALCTINLYALCYYGMLWYSIVTIEGFGEAFVPMDFLFRDIGFFSLVLFYYAAIVLSKFLDTACADYTVPIKNAPSQLESARKSPLTSFYQEKV